MSHPADLWSASPDRSDHVRHYRGDHRSLLWLRTVSMPFRD